MYMTKKKEKENVLAYTLEYIFVHMCSPTSSYAAYKFSGLFDESQRFNRWQHLLQKVRCAIREKLFHLTVLSTIFVKKKK